MSPFPPVSQIVTALVFAAAVAMLSRRLRLLTAGGATAQFVLGWILLSFGGWQWTLPVIVFFLTSTLLGLHRRQERSLAESRYAKTGPRDAGQVLANGGVAGILAVGWFYTQNDSLYLATLGSLAAATADTWATEIGVLFKDRPRLITTLERVESGTSGAVSPGGMIAAICGAAVLAASGLPWIHPEMRASVVLAVSGAGVVGSLVDSVLGATVQAVYRCSVCGMVTERPLHCSSPSDPVRGARWVNNDVVNLLCTISGSALSLIILQLLPD